MDLRQSVERYRTPDQAIEILKPIRTVILVGITAAGKDTIRGDVLRQSEKFEKVITSTTRAPRANNGVMEQEGVDYYFLTLEDAQRAIENGEYIEVANVHDRVNGSLVREYQRIAGLGKIALTDVDYQGAANFLTFGMDDLSVYFITPPSFEVYMARLLKRQGGTIGDHQEVLQRFRSAQTELRYALEHPEFIPLMNDVSSDTAMKIIQYAETGTSPADDERQRSYEAIRELDAAIGSYIEQVEGPSSRSAIV